MIEPFVIRERVEEFERERLSSWATLACESKGRDRYEDPDPIRTAFQQDRDRVLHADAFGRLAGKSHAFVPAEPASRVAGVRPPWRSRLSHALASSQLARTITRALRLNEDLAEAIALGHAMGAPAFGTAGVAALNDVVGSGLLAREGFSVGEQSLRVVESLAREGRGLNLTWEVRDGLLHQGWEGAPAATHEGQVARISCRLAAALHELAAALRGGVVHLDDVPLDVRTELGPDHGSRIATAVDHVVAASADQPEVRLGEALDRRVAGVIEFLDEHVHGRPEARAERDRARHCLESLAIHFGTNAGSLPGVRRGEVAQQVVDHLSGLTDHEARLAFSDRFLPSA